MQDSYKEQLIKRVKSYKWEKTTQMTQREVISTDQSTVLLDGNMRYHTGRTIKTDEQGR